MSFECNVAANSYLKMKKLLFVFLLSGLKLYAQESNVVSDTVGKVQVAAQHFPYVQYVSEVEVPLLAALNHFPELENVNIIFRYKNIRTTMVSRPTLGSLFRKNRTFVIYIDNYVSKNNGVTFQDIPHEARVGLIGHELCHIVDYQSKTNFQILLMGLKYAFSKNHYAVESHVDKLTIQKGLGNELYVWTDFILSNPEVTTKYKEFKKLNYLALEEILAEIEKLKVSVK